MRFETTFERFRAAAAALRRDRDGSVSMEYGLVGTLVSVAIISALSSTTSGLGDKWNSVANTINSFLR
ncbi:MAG: Flp family type IVb pilin [Siculibacillus sp.]|nr:Flp family type IVb pilin [Siculibacillus sp.]